MIKKKDKGRAWMKPSDIDGFQQCITDVISSLEAETYANDLNNKLTTALLESQKNFFPKTQKEEKLSQNTRQLMQQRRGMRSEMDTKDNELQRINKEISKDRQDTRKYKNRSITPLRTIKV